jgi:DNA-binding NtrC family response regulator
MIKLLLVDDEQAILKVLKWRLEMKGYQIDTALCGHEALKKIENNPPDLVLTDIRMPNMDGLTLVKTLQQTSYANIPCIVMSGHGDIDMAADASTLGAAGYIHKPVKFEELQQLIEQRLA